MKIFRLLLFLICQLTTVSLLAQHMRLGVQEQPQPATITLSLKNVPLETVLSQIKKQAGIRFVYTKDILKIAGKVSVQAEKADLETVLKQLFHNTSINFTVFGNTVELSTKKNANVSGNVQPDNSFFSKGIAHGFVYTTGGVRLNGAGVIIKRSHSGTVTNTKRLAMVEISQVNAKYIERQPVSNPLLALKGIVHGVLILPASGYSNVPVKVEIRGRNSIDPASASDPLYIIDGVPLIQANIGGVPSSNHRGGSTGRQQAGISFPGGIWEKKWSDLYAEA
ncbi:DUF4974 domain-containing protein [Mucilaginibacter gotjawali]|nr:DUF4974 domain-containing protein [Mucilaginibacter gotjawali]MBB3053803.1 hypothetical protein [Mucilaginibacter gotjawali]